MGRKKKLAPWIVLDPREWSRERETTAPSWFRGFIRLLFFQFFFFSVDLSYVAPRRFSIVHLTSSTMSMLHLSQRSRTFKRKKSSLLLPALNFPPRRGS